MGYTVGIGLVVRTASELEEGWGHWRDRAVGKEIDFFSSVPASGITLEDFINTCSYA